MARFFNGKEVELLAPAGNFEIFKEIINTGADAVYLGGKNFNMRLHRKDFNFTNEEILEAIKIAHSKNKKVYITLNNLMNESEMNEVTTYLDFLEEAQPDAIIVQDLGLVNLLKTRNSTLNIHSSVMMNVHNIETIHRLKDLGVTRVVTAREVTLAQISEFTKETDMEFEYFVHGDMCIAQGALCLYSGMLFGQSSNKGLCMKPCRWSYKVKNGDSLYDTTYPIAVKDMSMYKHIPELIINGVTSFKIEGRMRDAKYLTTIIESYSDAIDRYIKDPIAFERTKDIEKIFENRNRDLTTAFAFGNPGLSFINERFEGTGKFYSTGKVFSTATPETSITDEKIKSLRSVFDDDKKITKIYKLSVTVNNIDQALMAIEEKVNYIYLSGEVFEPNKPFTLDDIKHITKNKKESKIYLCLPKMTYSREFAQYNHFLNNENLGLDGLLTTNLGVINTFKNKNLQLVGDYSLNVLNSNTISFYKNENVERFTLSLEATPKDITNILKNNTENLEIIVHGKPTVMYLEYDLFENTKQFNKTTTSSSDPNVLYLVDEKDIYHPVYKDNSGKNHITLEKDLCYLPILDKLKNLGIETFRIEGQVYDTTTLQKIIKLYKQALEDDNNISKILENNKNEFSSLTFGAFNF